MKTEKLCLDSEDTQFLLAVSLKEYIGQRKINSLVVFKSTLDLEFFEAIKTKTMETKAQLLKDFKALKRFRIFIFQGFCQK
jgi:hypothetical protein